MIRIESVRMLPILQWVRDLWRFVDARQEEVHLQRSYLEMRSFQKNIVAELAPENGKRGTIGCFECMTSVPLRDGM